MALVAAAVCPHPPLLVPEVASGAAVEIDDLRVACATAVDTLRAAHPDLLVVVGSGTTTREHVAGSLGTFAGFGVERHVTLGGHPGKLPATLPLPLAVGAWLLESCGYDGRVLGLAVASGDDAGPAALATTGRADRVAMLVMGDGTARRTPKAPGAFDDRAEAFDRAVAEAFRDADCDALLALDSALADELMVAGLASWQALATAARDTGPWRGQVHYDDAPYGVGYLVATWLPA
ncbi:MAG TPA: class III extradiol dioxygenase subunit B-like domain-containing protein [Mycobacteriales bacterium]|nr:class III extradiol dioxygenase subunit B-like domain-containing protein [Mycobacteriales bacterium]